MRRQGMWTGSFHVFVAHHGLHIVCSTERCAFDDNSSSHHIPSSLLALCGHVLATPCVCFNVGRSRIYRLVAISTLVYRSQHPVNPFLSLDLSVAFVFVYPSIYLCLSRTTVAAVTRELPCQTAHRRNHFLKLKDAGGGSIAE